MSAGTQRLEEVHRAPEAGVPGGCEQPNMGAGNSLRAARTLNKLSRPSSPKTSDIFKQQLPTSQC